MSTLTANDLTGWNIDENTFNQHVQEALNTIEQLLCFRVLDSVNASHMNGIVDDDGLTVRLSQWARDISSVKNGTTELDFTFTPTVGDYQLNNESPVNYGRTITLAKPVDAGTVLDVTADTGFDQLPDSIKALIAGTIQALGDRADGSDYTSQKSIEDVSEQTINDKKADLTPIQLVMQTNQATVGKWSLCDKGVLHGYGSLAFPHQPVKHPWWSTSADYGRLVV